MFVAGNLHGDLLQRAQGRDDLLDADGSSRSPASTPADEPSTHSRTPPWCPLQHHHQHITAGHKPATPPNPENWHESGHARTLWRDCGLVFTTVTGRPVAPRDHSLHWTAFLEGRGIRPARLHDARHTAATLLLVQGVDQRVVMSMFGWTSPAMMTRYQHVVPEPVEEANRRMGELL